MFGAYAWEWYELYKLPKLKAAGVSYYKTALNHIVPVFGERQVRSITSLDLQRYLNALAEKYSKSSVERNYSTLKQIFKLATAQYIIDRDPMLTVVCPDAPEGKRRALTEAKTAAALYVARTHKYGLLWMLLYYTGARLGEVLGLQWQDINFKTREITFRRDIDYKVKIGKSKVGEVKSEYSERTIPIANELYEALKAARCISTYVIRAPKSDSHLPQSTAQDRIDTLRRAMYEYDNTIEHTDSPMYLKRHKDYERKKRKKE
ncbi:MAG: tyrosine-type recombinase/integrase [Christensenellales bacterium]